MTTLTYLTTPKEDAAIAAAVAAGIAIDANAFFLNAVRAAIASANAQYRSVTVALDADQIAAVAQKFNVPVSTINTTVDGIFAAIALVTGVPLNPADTLPDNP